MRKKALRIYFWIILIGILYAALICFTDIQLKCFIYEFTGMECPSCGATRMFASMAHLDLAAAFLYNPVLFVLFFVWNIIGGLCILDKVEFVKKPRFLYAMLLGSTAVFLIWGIFRNLF